MQNLDDNVEEPPKKKKKSIAVEKTNSCPLCEFSGCTNKELSVHMKNQHKMTQTTLNNCKECSQIFNKKTKLEDHMRCPSRS